MRILHVDDGVGWRGGQRQVELLLDDGDGLICPSASPLARRFPSSEPFGIRGLYRALRRYRPDVVAAHGSRAHDLALLQAGPVVVHRRVDFRRCGLKYRAVDGFVAVSRAVRDVLLEAGVLPERIRVVPDAVVPEAGRRLPRPEGLLVLAAGAGVPHKGHRVLVEAAANIDATVWIAGAKGVDHGNVKYLGWRTDLRDLLATADVFCHPSIEEGYGSVLLEARASGVPIVCTRAGGAPEAAGPRAVLVPPSAPDALAEAILRAAMLSRAPERLDAHRPEVIRSRTHEAYRELLGL